MREEGEHANTDMSNHFRCNKIAHVHSRSFRLRRRGPVWSGFVSGMESVCVDECVCAGGMECRLWSGEKSERFGIVTDFSEASRSQSTKEDFE